MKKYAYILILLILVSCSAKNESEMDMVAMEDYNEESSEYINEKNVSTLPIELVKQKFQEVQDLHYLYNNTTDTLIIQDIENQINKLYNSSKLSLWKDSTVVSELSIYEEFDLGNNQKELTLTYQLERYSKKGKLKSKEKGSFKCIVISTYNTIDGETFQTYQLKFKDLS